MKVDHAKLNKVGTTQEEGLEEEQLADSPLQVHPADDHEFDYKLGSLSEAGSRLVAGEQHSTNLDYDDIQSINDTESVVTITTTESIPPGEINPPAH